MYKKVPVIAYILFKYGNFSKPFLNLILEEELPEEWYYYFIAQRYKWMGSWEKGLAIIDRIQKREINNLTLYFLLLADKLAFLKFLKEPSADIIFEELRKDFFKIPLLARKIIAPTLWDYFITKFSQRGVSKLRLWSKDYIEDESTYLFILFNRANEEAKRGNLKRAIKGYFQGIKIAKDIPHPTGLIYCLNNSAWYLKDKHPLLALKLAKDAVYYWGYFRENLESGFFALDTLFHIQRKLRQSDIFEMGEVILHLYEKLPEGKGWGTKEHYKELKEFFEKRKLNLDLDIYENNYELRDYLKRLFKDKNLSVLSEELKITKTNLSTLLKGWTLRVKGMTIRKILDKYMGVDPFEAPFPILNEFLKEKIKREYFEKNRENFIKLFLEERIINFVTTYMSLINRDYFKRDKNLEKLIRAIREDFDEFLKKVDKDLYLMDFINKIFSSDPVVEARKCLALKFINTLPKGKRMKFINKYISLKEKERNMIDVFVRNYVRYDLKWETTPESKCIPEKFLKYYRVKKTPLILSIYYFDKRLQRRKLINLLDQMVI
ncbi:conserved hypothetical protein [Dictyoglomus turgidum DSM 6724]|jgi:hypothetical protein|uniref:Uncharacterized protein n=1 Tax=Dictyoglomus turgidum (strain DSM 6724 / Z-1310) TaxID=515635 RepID=B8E1M9_DICTD|nr:conserved hypothetical protein [Dictyoglomus turgidum DSM 6724]HBU31730.1 hypothetical protein [Dictyoglomus sp.]